VDKIKEEKKKEEGVGYKKYEEKTEEQRKLDKQNQKERMSALIDSLMKDKNKVNINNEKKIEVDSTKNKTISIDYNKNKF